MRRSALLAPPARMPTSLDCHNVNLVGLDLSSRLREVPRAFLVRYVLAFVYDVPFYGCAERANHIV